MSFESNSAHIVHQGLIAKEHDTTALSDRVDARAFEYAQTLIDAFDGGPYFYRNLNASAIASWLFEDEPSLKDELLEQGLFELFQQKLMQYCSELTEAAEIADELVESRNFAYSDSVEDYGEPSSPRLLFRTYHLAPRNIYKRYSPIVNRLYDRFRHSSHIHQHDSERLAPHTQLHEYWRWCDLDAVRAANDGTAFLMQYEDFPPDLKCRILESQAVVVPVKEDIKLSELVIHRWGVMKRNLSKSGVDDFVLSFSEDMLTIPLLRYETALLRFRNKLPIVYVWKDEIQLVEYDWNPIAYGHQFVSEARQAAAGIHAEQYRFAAGQNCLPGSLRVDAILPMPFCEYSASNLTLEGP
jgi:hypothetical protein